jgi:hypothetical protein
MMTFTTFIPKKRNDGRRVTKREIDAILRRLCERFGGYTASGEQEGEWTDPATGRVYPDRSIRVTVGCDRSRMAEAMEAVRDIGRQLGQLAMWFDVHGADGPEILDIE